MFNGWPGLLAKLWLTDTSSETCGGVYVFVDREAADLSRESDVFRAMTQNPHFADLRIEEYDVLDGPTAITGGPLVASVRS